MALPQQLRFRAGTHCELDGCSFCFLVKCPDAGARHHCGSSCCCRFRFFRASRIKAYGEVESSPRTVTVCVNLSGESEILATLLAVLLKTGGAEWAMHVLSGTRV